jgi:hypothetical protein
VRNPGTGKAAVNSRSSGRAASGRAALGADLKPFEAGNELGLKHGAGTLAHPELISRRGRLVAEGIARLLLESDYCPEQLRMPVFAAQVESWSRREAQAKLIYDYMSGMTVEQRIAPVAEGSQNSVVDQWLKAEASAERARDKLGLTPASYAKIRRDLGIADRLADDNVRRLGEAGRVIRMARGTDQAGGDG